jgi:hypothetical protein
MLVANKKKKKKKREIRRHLIELIASYVPIGCLPIYIFPALHTSFVWTQMDKITGYIIL